MGACACACNVSRDYNVIVYYKFLGYRYQVSAKSQYYCDIAISPSTTLHHTPFITPPPSFCSHAPSSPHAFRHSSPFVLLTCTLSTTHISSLLPLRSAHMHPLHHTHFVTPPPSFCSHAPSLPHAFRHSSPFVLFTCSLFTTDIY